MFSLKRLCFSRKYFWSLVSVELSQLQTVMKMSKYTGCFSKQQQKHTAQFIWIVGLFCACLLLQFRTTVGQCSCSNQALWGCDFASGCTELYVVIFHDVFASDESLHELLNHLVDRLTLLNDD